MAVGLYVTARARLQHADSLEKRTERAVVVRDAKLDDAVECLLVMECLVPRLGQFLGQHPLGLAAAAHAHDLRSVAVGEHRGSREALDYGVREDELEEFAACEAEEVASCLGASPADDAAVKVSALDLTASVEVAN